jgi:hypothetical protein
LAQGAFRIKPRGGWGLMVRGDALHAPQANRE